MTGVPATVTGYDPAAVGQGKAPGTVAGGASSPCRALELVRRWERRPVTERQSGLPLGVVDGDVGVEALGQDVSTVSCSSSSRAVSGPGRVSPSSSADLR